MTEQIPEIIRVTLNDINALRDLSIRTFTETFAGQNSENDMQKYISGNLSVEKLSRELNTAGSEFYFLKSGEHPAGYLKLNTGEAQTEKHYGNVLEIERIYALKEFHGKGMGQMLLDKSIEIARKKGCDYIWLGVWEENHKAISFYMKNGFKTVDKHIFKLGNDEQTDLIMKLELN